MADAAPSEESRPSAVSRLAFHLSRVVVAVGFLMTLGAMSLPFVTAGDFEQTAIQGDALPALLLLIPVFLITLIPDHARPVPKPLGWLSLVLGAAAFPYAIVKRFDANLLADTLGGSIGTGAALLVAGTFVALVGIVYGLVRAAFGVQTGGSPARTARIPRGRVTPTVRTGPGPKPPTRIREAAAPAPEPTPSTTEQAEADVGDGDAEETAPTPDTTAATAEEDSGPTTDDTAVEEAAPVEETPPSEPVPVEAVPVETVPHESGPVIAAPVEDDGAPAEDATADTEAIDAAAEEEPRVEMPKARRAVIPAPTEPTTSDDTGPSTAEVQAVDALLDDIPQIERTDEVDAVPLETEPPSDEPPASEAPEPEAPESEPPTS